MVRLPSEVKVAVRSVLDTTLGYLACRIVPFR